MAETNGKTVEKKESFFKKIVNSDTAKKVVQIGTTILAVADTAFLVWAYFDARSEASAPMITNEEPIEMEVETKPSKEVVNS